MDFNNEPSYNTLRDDFIQFGKKLNEIDIMDSDYFEQAWKHCSEFGLCGCIVPILYNGLDMKPLELLFALDGLGYICKDEGIVFSVCNHLFSCVVPIIQYGTTEQKKKYLPKLASGEYKGAHAMTESVSGSDSFAMNMKADYVTDGYILNGNKCFITNAPNADVYIVFAKTSYEQELNNVTAFIVEKGMKGFYSSKNREKSGLKNAPIGDLIFDDCLIPSENILGNVGDGFFLFNTAVKWERTFIFAAHLGRMKQQLETSVQYAKTREQFGRPIGEFQAISNKLADMRMNIEIGELLLRKSAWLIQEGKSDYLESAISKLFISEAYVQSSLYQLQIHGAHGYMEESNLGSQVMGSLASTLYAGTSEVLRNVIARWMGLKNA